VVKKDNACVSLVDSSKYKLLARDSFSITVISAVRCANNYA